MEEHIKSKYVKRTQKDYSMSLKLQIVSEIEQGILTKQEAQLRYGIQGNHTISCWLKKYGIFDWSNQSPLIVNKTPEQKILELEQQVKLLEKQKNLLEHQLENAQEKAIFFDMMIDIAEKELNIPIRKKYSPEQSTTTKRKEKKQ
ncbi:MAG: transposase [Bacteroidales bacterium]|jgi:transposase-like protein|nr:transposase [Bacteroidales bacterium]